MFIKQISVFLENTPGSLREMTELLGKGGVDLLALSLADTQNFGIVRLIVHSEQIDATPAQQLGHLPKRAGGVFEEYGNLLDEHIQFLPLH